jgi:hypothetical protein
MNYRIEGEHVYFDHIDFKGDAISLQGNGDMDFQSKIHLKFGASIGRGEVDMPVVKEVLRGASRQITQINIDGTLQDPQIHRETLPALNEAVQQLQNRK